MELVLRVQAESADRLVKTDEEGIPVTVAMLAFEAAGPHRKRVIPEKD